MALSAYITSALAGITFSAFALWLPAVLFCTLALMIWLSQIKPAPKRWTA